MRDTALIEKLVEQTPAGGDDAFYTNFTRPDSLSGAAVGDPLYLRPLVNTFAVPGGGENWLVLYRSESAGQNPTAVATSGIIVLPDRQAHPVPKGGYPLITWCHGTVGCANRVAPSRDTGDTGASPMNAYPKAMLGRFLDQGWAVAMTDYEALGTGTDDGTGTGLGPDDKLHPYLLGQSEARAALDIVLAARRLFRDEISQMFAIVGHSQGGQAALFAAANAPGRVDGLVGVAAIAPANHPFDIIQASANLANVFKNSGYAFSALFLAGAIAGSAADHADADPESIKIIDPGQVLSDDAFEFWPQVWNLSRAELGADQKLFGSLRGNEQFRAGPDGSGTGYINNPNADQQEFNRQLKKMNPNLAITVPVRISQALEDKRVQYQPSSPLTGPFPGTEKLIEELKTTNPGRVIEKLYDATEVDDTEGPLGAHFTTINVDTGPLIDWLLDKGLTTP
ncbi:alpha/beta fold hydrolase [Streptomyces sp. So13.3]|uniref:alpha/beta fold hydrolase n=1 Tax=Streptomyces sp. So13.3 TaxID=2136173 RepID=UPI001105E743|nr:alpha/beta fold hydrolase [Streptomyces sp. So13.3]QNA70589.1 alpha/beta fold hydrolase [Streptomyces sp. So13.3]